jgi:hypothetical protein
VADHYDVELGRQTCTECDVPFLGYDSETICGDCCDFWTEAQLRDEGVM